MKRKLLRQMLNEWSSNLWIVIEFIIVSVVIWYICDYFYVSYSVYNRPRGFDTSHCYLVTLQELTDKSPDFIPDRPQDEMVQDRLTIIERLRQMPEVEVASYSQNSYPYNGNNSSFQAMYDSIGGYGISRSAEPDFVKVFRYHGVNGESPEQLAEELKQGKYLLSETFFSSRKPELAVSKLDKSKIHIQNDSAFGEKIGIPVFPVRYSDYSTFNSFILFPTSSLLWCNELCIRVKDNMDKDIVEKIMKEGQNRFHVGNYIVTDVTSFDEIRDRYQTEESEQQRNYSAGMAFLLFNIFLGLLGTFWFRTQQRVQEVALRKVTGATSGMVFSRLISEGLLMLAIATPFAIGLDILIAHYELNQYLDGYLVWNRLAICAVVTFCLMAVMVIAGILFPAMIARKVQPAEALKDE